MKGATSDDARSHVIVLKKWLTNGRAIEVEMEMSNCTVLRAAFVGLAFKFVKDQINCTCLCFTRVCKDNSSDDGFQREFRVCLHQPSTMMITCDVSMRNLGFLLLTFQCLHAFSPKRLSLPVVSSIRQCTLLSREEELEGFRHDFVTGSMTPAEK
jgi:hypothetical protein